MAKLAGFYIHPVAAIFPRIEGEEFAALCADIKKNGLREPVTLYEGKILDGINRTRACQKIKIKIKTRSYRGKDPVGYVISHNLARRHLNESQRAMIAAKLANIQHGGDRKSEGATEGETSQKKAAQVLNSSERAVRKARKVIDQADPELVAAVEAGHVAVSAAEKLVDRPVREQRKVAREAAKGTPASKVVRELNRKDREKKMKGISKGNKALKGNKRYGVILADPSWLYNEGTTTPNRRIDNHYPPMSLEEICALPVQKLGLPDCVLFLWITSPLLLEAAAPVLDAWGFDYKSQWIWHKEGKIKKDGTVGGYRGTGYWAIIEHELVLICSRGDVPPPPPKARFKSVFSAPVGKHSEKPDEVHKRIEKMYPKASKIELFARTPRNKKWDVWGNQSK